MFLENNGALNIVDLNATLATIMGGGVIAANSPLNINTDQDIFGAMDLVADDAAAMPGDNLTIDANITHDGNGLLRFLAGDDIIHSSGDIESSGGANNEVHFLANQEGAGSGDGDDGGVVQNGGTLTADAVEFTAHESVTYAQPGNDVMRITATVTGAGFDLTYVDDNDLQIELINVADLVDITVGGAITDGDAAVDVIATNLLLVAETGIGAVADPLETQVTNLDVSNATSDGVFIANSGPLNLVDLNATLAFIAGGGVISATPLSIIAEQNITGAMDFIADNTPAVAGDNLTINANITHDGNGPLRFLAGDDIIHSSGAVISSGGADNQVFFLANQEGAASGDGDDGGAVQTGGSLVTGAVEFSAHESVDYTQAGNDVVSLTATVTGADFAYVDETDLQIASVTAVGLADITAGGAITDGDAAVDVSAMDLILVASAGIGEAADPLNTTVSNLDANNSISNGVFLINTISLALTDLNAANAEIRGGGLIEGRDLTILAEQNIFSAMDFAATSQAAAVGNNVVVNADVTHDGNGALRFVAGDDIEQTSGAVTSLGGGLNQVQILANQEGAGSGDGDDGGISQTGGTVVADELLFSSHESVDFQQNGNNVVRMAATVTGATFDFSYQDDDDLLIGDVDGVNHVEVVDGLITITLLTGALNEAVDDSVDNIITTTAAVLTAPGGIGNASALDLGGVVNLRVDTDAGVDDPAGDIDVRTDAVLTDLAVLVNPAGGLQQYEIVDNDAAVSNLTFSVVDLDTPGDDADLSVDDVSVAAGNMNFTLISNTDTVDGDLLINVVNVGVSVADSNVNLVTQGSILDDNAGLLNITAGPLSMIAAGALSPATIGLDADPLDLMIAGPLTAAAPGAGGVFLDQTGDLDLDVVNADTGEIRLDASGDLNEAVNDMADNIVTTGAVELIAPDGIGNASTLDLSGVVDLTLDTNETLDLETDAVLTLLDITVDPQTAASTYDVADNANLTFMLMDTGNDLALDDISVAAGDLQFTLTGDSGDMLVDQLSVGAGDVRLTPTLGSIFDNNLAMTNITAGSLILGLADVNTLAALDQMVGTGLDPLELAISGTLLVTAANNGVGGVFLEQATQLDVDLVDADLGDVVLSAGGHIESVSAARPTDINGNIIDLTVVSGDPNDSIGAGAGDRLRINGVDFSGSSTGGVFLHDIDSLMLQGVESTGTGTIDITTVNDLGVAAATSVETGNNDLNGGTVISLTPQGTLAIDPTAVLETGTGRVTGLAFGAVAPFTGDAFPVDFESDIDRTTGEAIIILRIDDTMGLNFTSTVDWRDVPEAFSQFDSRPQFVVPQVPPPAAYVSPPADSFEVAQLDGGDFYFYSHIYEFNPNADPTADIIVLVTLSGFDSRDGGDGISLSSNGEPVVSETFEVALSVPPGLVGFFIVLPTPEALPLIANQVNDMDLNFNLPNREPEDVQFVETEASTSSTGETETRGFALRVVVVGADGKLEEQFVDNLENFGRDEDGNPIPFEFEDLPKLFKRLSNERYRLYLIEADGERLILDFVIEDGRPVEQDPSEGEDAAGQEGPGDPALDPGQDDMGAFETGALLRGRTLAAQTSDDLRLRFASASPQQSASPFVSHGGVLLRPDHFKISEPDAQERHVFAD